MTSRKSLPPLLLEKLNRILSSPSSQLITSETSILSYSTPVSHHRPAFLPQVVLKPKTTQEVSDIVKVAREYEMVIIPQGANTALEGHCSTIKPNTMMLSTMDMDQILDVRDMSARLQPGVTREALNEELRDTGLFFPIDPGANASLGGMIATRASGTNAVRYGTMRDAVLSLEVVNANGDVIRTGRRAKKSSAGYDLSRLVVGSEGTLGIITEATVKLWGMPEAESVAVCQFENIKQAAECVSTVIQCGIPVARIEMMDQTCVRAVNEYSKLSLPADRPMLFFEFHGSENSVREQAEMTQELSKEFGGSDFRYEMEQEKRTALWKARHAAYWATCALVPGARALTTDVCVPISCLADCIEETKRDFDESGLTYTLVGHVGDGNFHLICMLRDEKDHDICEKYNERLVERAIAMDGTCTGEHGVGLGKMKFIEKELGAEAVEWMQLIKEALDPQGIFNPGKIVDLKRKEVV
mmetsp:Transcript_8033/g.29853  ORF Transcript_8033/g.29853 Transcript_8033/m.29853 type:complete len:471 (-) Transcript_8033:71-1483(-)